MERLEKYKKFLDEEYHSVIDSKGTKHPHTQPGGIDSFKLLGEELAFGIARDELLIRFPELKK